MKLRASCYFMLALLLLFAQQGAVVHALSHLSGAAPVEAQQEQQSPDIGLHSCDKCSGYAGLAGALHPTALMVHAQDSAYTLPALLVIVISLPALQGYFSRAPPALV